MPPSLTLPMTDTPNATSHTEDFGFQELAAAANYRAALLGEFAPYLKGNVVDIGAGIGQFTEALRALAGVSGMISIEPEARFCRKFRQLHPTFAVVEGTIDDLPPGSDWDAMVSINVLEHIRDDEAELAKYARRLVAGRGHLCLFIPARPELHAPIDQDFGHFRRYVKPELRAKLERAGFEVVRLEYFNFIGYFAWWFNFCLLKKRQFDVASVVLFDRFIFPAAHWLEAHVMRPPFGQSLLAVARVK
jgi:SAM-dependent methyltransferase